MSDVYNKPLVVGQWVHCTLYGGKDGVIYAIHREQRPDSCGSIGGGVGVMGGNATFDIVWTTGTISRATPESLVRSSVQWRIYEDVADQDAVDDLLMQVEFEDIRREREQQEESERKEQLRQKYLAEFPYLKRFGSGAGYVDSLKLASQNVRTELKRTFPKTRFSVRIERGGSGSINVSWTDGPTSDQVKRIVAKYKEGSFNGMEDIYEYNHAVWPSVFGGARFTSTRRDYTDALVAEAINDLFDSELKANYQQAGIAKPSVEDFRSGKLYNVYDPARHHHGGESVQGDIHDWLSNYSGEAEAKPDTEKANNEREVICDDDAFEVREGTKAGYVEVKFLDKPDADVRSVLKAARFRWSRTNGVWYGREEQLPAMFASTATSC